MAFLRKELQRLTFIVKSVSSLWLQLAFFWGRKQQQASQKSWQRLLQKHKGQRLLQKRKQRLLQKPRQRLLQKWKQRLSQKPRQKQSSVHGGHLLKNMKTERSPCQNSLAQLSVHTGTSVPGAQSSVAANRSSASSARAWRWQSTFVLLLSFT